MHDSCGFFQVWEFKLHQLSGGAPESPELDQANDVLLRGELYDIPYQNQ